MPAVLDTSISYPETQIDEFAAESDGMTMTLKECTLPQEALTSEETVSFQGLFALPENDIRVLWLLYSAKSDTSSEAFTYHGSFMGPFHAQYAKLIHDLDCPPQWQNEGVSRPDIRCRDQAFHVCCHLYETYRLMPDDVKATRSGAVCLYYSAPDTGRKMNIEVDEDLDTIVIVSNRDGRPLLNEVANGSGFHNIIRALNE